VWDLNTNQQSLTFLGHAGAVTGVAFDQDGRRLVSSGADGTVRIWDPDPGQEVLTLRTTLKGFSGVAFSPDGRLLATGGGDNTARLWDIAGREVRTLRGPTRPVLCVAFSPDGRHLAGGDADGLVRLWDATTGQEDFRMGGPPGGPVMTVAFDPAGRLVSAGKDGTVRVWDPATGRETRTLRGHKGSVMEVAFGPAGRLVSGGSDGTVRIWEADTGRETLRIQGFRGGVLSVAFSPDGKLLAAGSGDGRVRLWDAGTGQEILALLGDPGKVQGLAFSPDGRRLASGVDGQVRLWDVATGQEVLTPTGALPLVPRVILVNGLGQVYTRVAFSPDGRRLACCHGSTVKVWETALSGEDLQRREVVSLVRERFERLLVRSDLLAGLREDPTLTPPERDFALQVARELPGQDLSLQNAITWRKFNKPGLGFDLALAVREARAAAEEAPGNGAILETLGGAYYRLEDYARALEILTQAEKLTTDKEGPEPGCLAFLAMTRHRLGQKEAARTTLERLREVMRQPRWANDDQRRGLLREAEELLQGKGKSTAK
jgi:WD40 repeat protein